MKALTDLHRSIKMRISGKDLTKLYHSPSPVPCNKFPISTDGNITCITKWASLYKKCSYIHFSIVVKENRNKFTSFFFSFASFPKKIKHMLRKEKWITISLNDKRKVTSGAKQFLQNSCTDPFTGKLSHYSTAMFNN